MSTTKILVSSDQHAFDARAFKTVRVTLFNDAAWHDDTFQPLIRRVEFDKVPALFAKWEAKFDISPTSHHREQYELLAQKRAAL